MVLVFGKNGQVAKALERVLPSAVFLGSTDANFLKPEEVLNQLNSLRPKIVINAAAYTQVDKAESEFEQALTINSQTPGKIAEWCKENDAVLIHYSTDYVFDGTGETPWIETDIPNPINKYGITKYEGEKAIQKSECKHYILRVGWIYSPWGSNFKKTILRLAEEREELKVVADQWGSPTRAEDVAEVTNRFIQNVAARNPNSFGIYHFRFGPFTTWYQFALDILQEAVDRGAEIKVKRVLPIDSESYVSPAKRPKNCRLNSIHRFGE